MDDVAREELRRLALWLARRRAVDEAVALLTACGPAACDRLHTHLDALKQLLAAEHEAFAAVDAAAPAVRQSPLPDTVGRDDLPRTAPDAPWATVHSLSAARARQPC